MALVYPNVKEQRCFLSKILAKNTFIYLFFYNAKVELNVGAVSPLQMVVAPLIETEAVGNSMTVTIALAVMA